MSRFSQFTNILKGTRAIKRVTCPVVNVSANATADSPEAPLQFECGVRVLTGAEHEDVYAKALARTKRLGGEDRDDSHLYNLSLQVYTIASAYVDPDSDPESPKLYFGDNIEDAAEKILKSELLSRDTLAYLAEVQESWQEQCNPQTAPSRDEMLRCIEEGAKDASFFLLLRPGARQICMLTMAQMLVDLLKDKSSASSPSKAEQEKRSSEPERTHQVQRRSPTRKPKPARSSKRSKRR